MTACCCAQADVEAVNRSLGEVNRELTQRPTIAELNRVVGEQSLIMESLCSEHQLGRWIWKSGKTRGEKHTVPWNVQNINTNLDNFGWEQDKSAITCAAPGLYEVSDVDTQPPVMTCIIPHAHVHDAYRENFRCRR